MKTFVTLSALLGAAAALPHHGYATHYAQPYAVPHFAPAAYHVPYFQPQIYHSNAEANCHPEKEVFNVQSCLPSFEIVCEDKNIQQQTIKYEKKCTDVVSQVCGNQHPVSVVLQETNNGDVQEVEDNDLPVENKVYFVAPGAPVVRHQCWDIPQEHCYLEPIVETQETVVPACHVVNKPVCTETSHEVSKVVCNKEAAAEAVAEVEHEHEDGTIHTHEGGDMPHEHDEEEEHTHEDGTTHTHAKAKAAHVHAPVAYHQISPYSAYYYYPQQNLYSQFGIYNVVNGRK